MVKGLASFAIGAVPAGFADSCDGDVVSRQCPVRWSVYTFHIATRKGHGSIPMVNPAISDWFRHRVRFSGVDCSPTTR